MTSWAFVLVGTYIVPCIVAPKKVNQFSVAVEICFFVCLLQKFMIETEFANAALSQ